MYGKNKKTPFIGKIIVTTAVVFMAASTSLTFASDSSSTGQQQFMKMPPVFAS